MQAVDRTGNPTVILAIYTDGTPETSYTTLKDVPPFDRMETRLEMNARLNAIPGVVLKPESAVNATWPRIQREPASTDEGRRIILEALDWAAARLADPSDDLGAARA